MQKNDVFGSSRYNRNWRLTEICTTLNLVIRWIHVRLVNADSGVPMEIIQSVGRTRMRNKGFQYYAWRLDQKLHQRAHEHSTSEASALNIHSVTTGHSIDFQNPLILDKDNNRYRLAIKESLHIFQSGALSSLNRNLGSCNLQLWDPHVQSSYCTSLISACDFKLTARLILYLKMVSV